MTFATWNIYFRFAVLEFFFVGVPTQIKIISEDLIEELMSVVKESLF